MKKISLLTETLKQNHKKNRPALEREIKEISREELERKYFIELGAKSKAYYFLLDNGLLLSFAEYCGALKEPGVQPFAPELN